MSLAFRAYQNLRSGKLPASRLALRADLGRGSIVSCPAIRTGALSHTVDTGRLLRKDYSVACAAGGEPEYIPASTSKEEWLQIDAKVNTYPSQRVFKAIGSASSDAEEFVSSIVSAVEEAGDQAVLKKTQVTQRPSKNGRYLAVSVRDIHVESGEQVYGIYEAIRAQCGDRLKFII